MESGTPLTETTVCARPDFLGEVSPRGVQLGQIAQMHGPVCLGSTIHQACSRKAAGEGVAAFCGIDLSLRAGATILEKAPSELGFAAGRARRAGARHAVLTTGAGPAAGEELAAAARAIQDEGLAVQIQVPFPIGRAEIEALSFADSIGIHVESLDERVLDHLAPAKSAAGLESAFQAIAEAVEVFGRGRVNSFVILGLGEGIKATQRGVQRLAELGAYPYLVPLRPLAGTALGGMTPPSAARVVALSLSAAHAAVREKLYWREIGAGCGRCSCCSPVPDFEDALRAGPETGPVRDEEELDRSRAVRERVFVGEQQLFATTDEDSLDATARVLVARTNAKIVGTVRFNETSPGEWSGGRLAVTPDSRGKGAGAALIAGAVDEVERLGANRFSATILDSRAGLFERLGWKGTGTSEILGLQHVTMEAPLATASAGRCDPEAIAGAARKHPGNRSKER